jgi:hypothetical protein
MRQDPAHLEAPETAPSLIDQQHTHERRDCRAASAAVRQTLRSTAVQNVRQRLPLVGE